jgi:hypothetical protein
MNLNHDPTRIILRYPAYRSCPGGCKFKMGAPRVGMGPVKTQSIVLCTCTKTCGQEPSTILILDPSQRRQIRKLITSPKLAAPRKHVVTSLLHGVQHPTAESRNEHTHQGLLFWAETQHQALILKPLRGEAAREAQRLRARAQCVLTALSYRRTRFRPQPALWKNPVFSGLVCRSALKDHIFDTLWPEHCQQRRSCVFCTSSAVLASAACTSYNWTANSTAVESEKWRIAWGVLPLHWLRYAARGIAIARNWILLATATWHAPTRSCQPRKLPRPAVPTSQFSTTRPQRDMEKSHRADTFSINGNKGPEIPNLGTKGSFRTPSSARENLKFEVGERFKQVLAPVVFQAQASPPPNDRRGARPGFAGPDPGGWTSGFCAGEYQSPCYPPCSTCTVSVDARCPLLSPAKTEKKLGSCQLGSSLRRDEC